MKGRPHISELCECRSCSHYDAAVAVVKMLKDNYCLGVGVLTRIASEAAEGDAGQIEMLETIEGLLDASALVETSRVCL